jgi:exonuclease III
MFWNAQGINNKLTELRNFLITENIDVVCLTETHLSNNTISITFPGYAVVRKDRPTHMGGLITLIKDDIKFNQALLPNTKLLECVAITIFGDKPYSIINTYLPGGARAPQIRSDLSDDLKSIHTRFNNQLFMLLGDMNAKHTS